MKGRFYFPLVLFLVSCGVVSDPSATLPAVGLLTPNDTVRPRPLKGIMDSLGWSNEPIRILVDKSDRRMELSVKDTVLKSYLIVLGLNPNGDKHFQGDKKTPEGTFTFRAKYPHANWHKFVWVDYPNEESWRRFNKRKADGTIPSDAKIGAEIGIHGVPDGMDEWIVRGQDWTFGCIAMRNDDLDEIYPLIKPKATKMIVVP